MRTVRLAATAVALAGFLLGCATAARPPRIPTIDQLTLDEKIGQMFVFASSAPYMSESSPAYRELLRQVKENKVGGVIWSISNVYETAWVTERLQSAARVPLIIAADLENGSGMRFQDTTTWPSAMAVAATGDPVFAERQGEITAIESKAIGVNQIYAPVADVNVNPDNPVINTRSYGEDPAEVGRYVAAFVRGAQRGGVLATVKHFPGHGDTKTDSHRSLPVLEMSRERLEAVELVPFRAAIEAGVGSVMSGHVAIPALDDTPAPLRDRAEAARDNPDALEENETEGGTVPASVSPKMLAGLLRRDLGFTGLIVTDSFSMGGVVSRFAPGEAAIRGIEAGNDQILKPANIDLAIAAVKEAVRTGRITEARIDESVRRILAAKERFALGGASQEAIFRTVDVEEHRRVASEIATRAITLVREEAGVLPL
ncbi:MAG: glycoside hydrolase family 3 protein, partial [Thermoanaerobaculia bacterium]